LTCETNAATTMQRTSTSLHSAEYFIVCKGDGLALSTTTDRESSLTLRSRNICSSQQRWAIVNLQLVHLSTSLYMILSEKRSLQYTNRTVSLARTINYDSQNQQWLLFPVGQDDECFNLYNIVNYKNAQLLDGSSHDKLLMTSRSTNHLPLQQCWEFIPIPFEPNSTVIPNGTYCIQNRQTGKYLNLLENGYIVTAQSTLCSYWQFSFIDNNEYTIESCNHIFIDGTEFQCLAVADHTPGLYRVTDEKNITKCRWKILRTELYDQDQSFFIVNVDCGMCLENNSNSINLSSNFDHRDKSAFCQMWYLKRVTHFHEVEFVLEIDGSVMKIIDYRVSI
jgi:hypothetical protein